MTDPFEPLETARVDPDLPATYARALSASGLNGLPATSSP